jgi:hypothetical protein
VEWKACNGEGGADAEEIAATTTSVFHVSAKLIADFFASRHEENVPALWGGGWFGALSAMLPY